MTQKWFSQTMPDIKDLVKDIYSLFDGERIVLDDKLLADFGNTLSSTVGSKLAEEHQSGFLRLSNIGKPFRQLWYEINDPAGGEKITPHTHIKFMYGHLVEHLLIYLARVAGHEVANEQIEVDLDGVPGHPDCTIDGCVVDVKSASSYAFQKFANGSLLEEDNDTFGYVAQLASYREILTPGKPAYFLAIDKSLGKLHLLEVPSERLDQVEIRNRIRLAREAVVQDNPPERCYSPKPEGKSGNLALAVGCSYCGRKERCWADANDGRGLRKFFYSSGPKWLVKVVKEPNVPEDI